MKRFMDRSFMLHSEVAQTLYELAIRFGESLKEYERRDMDLSKLICIPIVIAGYLRYLIGIDDNGNTFELSSDPIIDEVKDAVKNIKIGDKNFDKSKIMKLLSNESIFGVDLVRIGLSNKIIEMFKEMIGERGAVNKTLEKYLN